jgi:hypothetical protein
LRPDINEIEIPVAEAFRFKRRASCLNVQADLEGSRQQIDSQPSILRRAKNLLVHARTR